MQAELSKCLVGMAAFTAPIWIPCLIGTVCWCCKHLILRIRANLDALADAKERP